MFFIAGRTIYGLPQRSADSHLVREENDLTLKKFGSQRGVCVCVRVRAHAWGVRTHVAMSVFTQFCLPGLPCIGNRNSSVTFVGYKMK